MTVGPGNGEPDDPYGYLYRPGPGEEAPPPGSTPGRVMPQYVQVGQTQPGMAGYGAPSQPPPQPPQGVPQQPGHQPFPGQPAPPGPHDAQPPTGGRRANAGRSQNSRGPLFAVLGVLLVIAIVVGIVLSMSGGDDDKAEGTNSTVPVQVESSEPSEEPTTPVSSGPAQIGQVEAENAQPSGVTTATVKGSTVLTGWQKGSSITWSVDAPSKGSYRLYMRYGNGAPKDGSPRPSTPLMVSVNGESPRSINLYGLGDPDIIGTTWSVVSLKKGSNLITITCAADAGCPVIVDRMYFVEN